MLIIFYNLSENNGRGVAPPDSGHVPPKKSSVFLTPSLSDPVTSFGGLPSFILSQNLARDFTGTFVSRF